MPSPCLHPLGFSPTVAGGEPHCHDCGALRPEPAPARRPDPGKYAMEMVEYGEALARDRQASEELWRERHDHS